MDANDMDFKCQKKLEDNADTTTSVDLKRRKFLVRATAAMTAVGAAAAAVPFISSLWPNARAQAQGGPVRVKVGMMKPDDQLTVIWRGKPIWIVRRKQEEINQLAALNPLLRDPHSEIEQQPPYAKNIYRSRRPEFLVLVGVCTHLGCTPTYRPEPKSVTKDWPGGFFCTCHGSKFDMAGRVFKGVPAPINLEVPPHVFVNNDEILIGVDKAPEGA
jgi:ubiquinol-cytochrome c reductase iron-sulfur subunit